MIRLQTEKGEVSISDAALSNITGAAATSCFGVKGMAYRSMTDGLVHLLRREAMSKGVRIIPHEEGDISIELHIVVEHGVNQVRDMVSENTGASIRSIDVCVDSMNMYKPRRTSSYARYHQWCHVQGDAALRHRLHRTGTASYQ